MQTIKFLESGIKSNLKQKKVLKEFLIDLLNNEQKLSGNINIIFCTDEFLLSLNKIFLNHNYYTDTLTFPLSEHPKAASGEIYISIDRIKENSLKFNANYQIELVGVIIHSCLHLCGYKDKPKKEEVKMLVRQEDYLAKWLFHVEH